MLSARWSRIPPATDEDAAALSPADGDGVVDPSGPTAPPMAHRRPRTQALSASWATERRERRTA